MWLPLVPGSVTTHSIPPSGHGHRGACRIGRRVTVLASRRLAGRQPAPFRVSGRRRRSRARRRLGSFGTATRHGAALRSSAAASAAGPGPCAPARRLRAASKRGTPRHAARDRARLQPRRRPALAGGKVERLGLRAHRRRLTTTSIPTTTARSSRALPRGDGGRSPGSTPAPRARPPSASASTPWRVCQDAAGGASTPDQAPASAGTRHSSRRRFLPPPAPLRAAASASSPARCVQHGHPRARGGGGRARYAELPLSSSPSAYAASRPCAPRRRVARAAALQFPPRTPLQTRRCCPVRAARRRWRRACGLGRRGDSS